MAEAILYNPGQFRAMLIFSAITVWVAAAGLIWLSSPWTAVGLVIGGTLVILSRISLRTAVLVFLLLMPFDLHRQIGQQWVYLDLLTVAIAIPLIRLKRWPPALCWLMLPFFVYFVVTGAPRSILPAWFWGYSVRWLIALSFSAAISLSTGAEDFILAVGGTLIPLTAYGLYQLAIGDFGWLYNWMNPHMLDQPWIERSYSVMWHPNAFANFVAMASIMLIALGAKGYRPNVSFSLAAIGLVGLLGSGSRGAEIATAFGVLIVLLQARKFWLALAIVLVLGAIVWTAQHYDVAALRRAEELDDFTTQTRLLAWGEAYLAWQQDPWFGVGTTNFSQLMQNFGDLQTAHAHNTYLQILAENGLVGFFLFFTPLGYLLWRAWKGRMVPIVFAGGCALLVWFAHAFVDVELADNPQCLLLLFTAIGMIVRGLSTAEHSDGFGSAALGGAAVEA